MRSRDPLVLIDSCSSGETFVEYSDESLRSPEKVFTASKIDTIEHCNTRHSQSH